MIESLPLVLTGLGLTASIIYYANILNNANKTRELQLKAQEEAIKTRNATLHVQLIRDVLSPEGIEKILILENTPVSSFEEWQKAMSNPEYRNAWAWYCVFLEEAGNLLRHNEGSHKYSAGFQPGIVESLWKQYKPIIYELRKERGPSFYRNMEYYMDAVEKYWKEHPELAP